MSELRKDPIVDRWVIIAENRAARPIELVEAALAWPAPSTTTTSAAAPGASPPSCDFCEGREASTPSETLAYRPAGLPADGPGWQVRVVPNKFPAVELGPAFKLGPAVEAAGLPTAANSGLFGRASGRGVHEVVVESPQHLTAGAQQTPDELAKVFRAYRDRMLSLRAAGEVRHVLVFKNVGAAAGASLAHVHSQLIGLPSVPRGIADELAGAALRHAERGACAYCDLIAAERAEGSRVVLDTGEFLLICPWASRLAHELWILPARHASHFELDRHSSLSALADLLNWAVRRLEISLGLRAYNYWLHSAPFDSTDCDHYHWHIEILPRATQIAGLEWGAGVYVNPMSPERAAQRLRAAEP